MASAPLIRLDETGLVCDPGGFRIDPDGAADCAVVTHAHADHARRGAALYIASSTCAPLLRARLGKRARVRAIPFGEAVTLGDTRVSLHPAGHVLGSAQVRVERGGEVWVVTGDFKRDADPSCEPFELVRCDTLITEATFGAPGFAWQPASAVMRQIMDWWLGAPDRASVLFCYALGKTQRVLAELAGLTERTVYLHPGAMRMTEIYRRAGIRLAATARAAAAGPAGPGCRGDLLIAPPAALGTRWMSRLRDPQTAFVSGWMADGRPPGRYDRGFALSDHADWAQLAGTVGETGARSVYVMHGDSAPLARRLRDELGIEAQPVEALSGDGNGREE
jgi:putative mRNA 3-end processing factor